MRASELAEYSRRMPARFCMFAAVALVLLGGLWLVTSSAHGQDAGGSERGAPIRIVAFGDSLTAGYGIPQTMSFPSQLQRALVARGHDVIVANAGVSGDTTSGGLARFDWSVPDGTDAVILELGANDVLRGVKPSVARANLDAIVTRLKSRKIPTLIAGMRSLRNWGEAYTAAFDPIFSELASKHAALFYPFFLEGVALDPKLNLPDGMHPNPKGVGEIVKRMLSKVEELILRVKAQRAAAAGVDGSKS